MSGTECVPYMTFADLTKGYVGVRALEDYGKTCLLRQIHCND